MPVKTPTTQFVKETQPNGRLRTVKLSSYAVLLMEKDGHQVQAVRLDYIANKEEAHKKAAKAYPDWRIKGVWRLYDEDF